MIVSGARNTFEIVGSGRTAEPRPGVRERALILARADSVRVTAGVRHRAECGGGTPGGDRGATTVTLVCVIRRSRLSTGWRARWPRLRQPQVGGDARLHTEVVDGGKRCGRERTPPRRQAGGGSPRRALRVPMGAVDQEYGCWPGWIGGVDTAEETVLVRNEAGAPNTCSGILI
jgi:hypothetical protein